MAQFVIEKYTHFNGESSSSARAMTAWSRASVIEVQERSISTRLWRHLRITNSKPSADWRVAVQPKQKHPENDVISCKFQ